MANPYHDAEGKFCSRDQMLNSIHNLAVTGKVPEYIQLKQEFDEIDKGNIVVSKDLIQNVLQTAKLTGYNPKEIEELEHIVASSPLSSKEDTPTKVSTGSLYQAMDSGTLYEIVANLSYKTKNGEGDYREEILNLLETTEYDDQALYGAIEGKGLSYEDKLNLIVNHNRSLFNLLAQEHPQRVMGENKQEFMSAIQETADKAATLPPTDSESYSYSLSGMIEVLAANTSDPKDIDFAVKNLPYSSAIDHSIVAVASNPALTKHNAVVMLNHVIMDGTPNYWALRNALSDNFKTRGIQLPENNEEDWHGPGLAGKPSGLLFKDLARIEAGDTTLGRFDKEARINHLQARIDSYEDNLKVLRKEYKTASDVKTRVKLSRRLQLAEENVLVQKDIDRILNVLVES